VNSKEFSGDPEKGEREKSEPGGVHFFKVILIGEKRKCKQENINVRRERTKKITTVGL